MWEGMAPTTFPDCKRQDSTLKNYAAATSSPPERFSNWASPNQPELSTSAKAASRQKVGTDRWAVRTCLTAPCLRALEGEGLALTPPENAELQLGPICLSSISVSSVLFF